MKKLLILGLFSCFAGKTLAGEAFIPYWSKWPSETTCLSVSNISNNDVNIKVTLYKQDGSKYLGSIEFAENISSLDQDTLLAANGTAYFCLARSSGGSFGYGKISTTEVNEENGNSFVIAHSRQVLVSGGYHSSGVPINNGMPF